MSAEKNPPGSTRPGVGQLVRRLRERRGLSQRALSDLIGRSPSYVHKMESGTLDPCAGAFARMAVAMDLSPHEAWVALRLLAAEDEERVTVTPSLYHEHSLVTAERSV